MAQSYDEQKRLLAEVIYSPQIESRIRSKYPSEGWMIDETRYRLWERLSKFVASRRADADAVNYPGLALNDDDEPMSRLDFERLASGRRIAWAFGDVVRCRDRWYQKKAVDNEAAGESGKSSEPSGGLLSIEALRDDSNWEPAIPGPDEQPEPASEKKWLDLLLRHSGQLRPDLVASRDFLVGLGVSLAARSYWAECQPVPGKGPDKHLFKLIDPVQFDLGYKVGGETAASFIRLSEEYGRQIKRRCRAAVRKAVAALKDEGVDND